MRPNPPLIYPAHRESVSGYSGSPTPEPQRAPRRAIHAIPNRCSPPPHQLPPTFIPRYRSTTPCLSLRCGSFPTLCGRYPLPSDGRVATVDTLVSSASIVRAIAEAGVPRTGGYVRRRYGRRRYRQTRRKRCTRYTRWEGTETPIPHHWCFAATAVIFITAYSHYEYGRWSEV